MSVQYFKPKIHIWLQDTAYSKEALFIQCRNNWRTLEFRVLIFATSYVEILKNKQKRVVLEVNHQDLCSLCVHDFDLVCIPLIRINEMDELKRWKENVKEKNIP